MSRVDIIGVSQKIVHSAVSDYGKGSTTFTSRGAIEDKGQFQLDLLAC